MKFSHKRSFSNHESYMAQCLALAILTMGIVKTIGSDDLLGAFAAGKSSVTLSVRLRYSDSTFRIYLYCMG